MNKKIFMNRSTYSILVLLTFIIGITLPWSAYACGFATYTRVNTTVELSDEVSQALIVMDGGKEHLVISPAFRGDASDFAMAFAFPSRPEIKEASQQIFSQLERFTEPKKSLAETIFFGAAPGASQDGGSSARRQEPVVKVIEQKRVGDFIATVLTANDSGALAQWLKKNGYQSHDFDRENFDYYIAKGGFYFVALRITIPPTEASEDIQDFSLSPIKFTFKTKKPFFPSRLARDNDPIQKIRFYTLSKKALIVPGAALPFSKQLEKDSYEADYYLSSLEDLIKPFGSNVWLTTLDMLVDPSVIEHDLTLDEWKNPEEFHMESSGAPLLLEPDHRDAKAGIAKATPSELKFTTVKYETMYQPQPSRDVPPEPYKAQYQDIRDLIRNSISVILGSAGLVFGILMLVSGAHLVIAIVRKRAEGESPDDAMRLKRHKRDFFWSLVALLLSILLYSIFWFILMTLTCCVIQQ